MRNDLFVARAPGTRPRSMIITGSGASADMPEQPSVVITSLDDSAENVFGTTGKSQPEVVIRVPSRSHEEGDAAGFDAGAVSPKSYAQEEDYPLHERQMREGMRVDLSHIHMGAVHHARALSLTLESGYAQTLLQKQQALQQMRQQRSRSPAAPAAAAKAQLAVAQATDRPASLPPQKLASSPTTPPPTPTPPTPQQPSSPQKQQAPPTQQQSTPQRPQAQRMGALLQRSLTSSSLFGGLHSLIPGSKPSSPPPHQQKETKEQQRRTTPPPPQPSPQPKSPQSKSQQNDQKEQQAVATASTVATTSASTSTAPTSPSPPSLALSSPPVTSPVIVALPASSELEEALTEAQINLQMERQWFATNEVVPTVRRISALLGQAKANLATRECLTHHNETPTEQHLISFSSKDEGLKGFIGIDGWQAYKAEINIRSPKTRVVSKTTINPKNPWLLPQIQEAYHLLDLVLTEQLTTLDTPDLPLPLIADTISRAANYVVKAWELLTHPRTEMAFPNFIPATTVLEPSPGEDVIVELGTASGEVSLRVYHLHVEWNSVPRKKGESRTWGTNKNGIGRLESQGTALVNGTWCKTYHYRECWVGVLSSYELHLCTPYLSYAYHTVCKALSDLSAFRDRLQPLLQC
eukprot:TRINITY_DN834_c0_g1_i3.p1 TRINITY_DN834_c0_g1~~TRINITY_DN834_c0_g1_i3.p1  ORF type:complete len:717 (-),score=175.23 TRINITY_DN834_c0_g1_i3:506-2413(-)